MPWSEMSATLDVYGELRDEGHERLAERVDVTLRANVEQDPTDAAVYTFSG
jgi:hypothetical protein